MRRLVGAAVVTLGLTVPLTVTAPAQAAKDSGGGGHRVVADELNNPRALNWSEDERTLIVAEAGSGGETCSDDVSPEGEVQCTGFTSSVTTVRKPWRQNATQERVIEGLFSSASPDGSAATGGNAADATDTPNEYIIAGSDAVTGPTDPAQAGRLLVASEGEGDDRDFVFSYADIAAAEKDQNPDTAQIESNPYGVIFVDGQDRVQDGYALVADAAANTVWKIVPDFAGPPPPESCETLDPGSPPVIPAECLPPYAITPFVTYPTVEEEPGTEGPVEFVPTSLAIDHDGHLFVGGLGSLQVGGAQVVKYDLETKEELRRWTGFTSVTGVAVANDRLYVSELFGPTFPFGPPPEGAPPSTGLPGRVVVVDRSAPTRAPRTAVDVPFPAGLATDNRGNVFASVHSIVPAAGLEEGPENPFGAVEGGMVWDLDLTLAHPIDPE